MYMYSICNIYLIFVLICKMKTLFLKIINFSFVCLTFEIFDFWAFYGPLFVTIVLGAKNCVDRSFAELWRFEQVEASFGGDTGS